MFNLGLLKIPSFAAAAVVALAGMFGFIGTAYCVSIRLGAVMHLSPLRAGMPFVILQLIPLLLAPVLSKMLTRVDARWLLMGGTAAHGRRQFWIAALPITTTSPRRLHRPGAAARRRLHLRGVLADLRRRERRTDQHDRHGQRCDQPGPRVRPGPRPGRHQHHRDERRVLRPRRQAQRGRRGHGEGGRPPSGRQRGQLPGQGRRADRPRPRHGPRRGDLRLRLPAGRGRHPAAGAQEHRARETVGAGEPSVQAATA
ncbi:hypothetical protein ACRAWF_18860, partial [Streptomyces sp. L7]